MSNARKLAANLPMTGATGSRNIIINGAMQVSQRHGTSSVTVAAGDHYVVDRFKIQDYSDATFSSQQVTDAPEGFRNSSKITVTGTDTSLGTTQYQRFIQPIEGLNVSHLNYGWGFAQTTTLSFHVKSSLTGTFSVFVFNSAANRSFISTYTISAANTWEKKTITITGDQGGTWLKDTGVGMYLGWSLGTGTNFQTSNLNAWGGSFKMAGTSQVNLAGTNGATWQVAGCQLEVGSQASPFEHRSYGDELLRCQRYYFQSPSYSAGSSGTGADVILYHSYTKGASNWEWLPQEFPVEMRANPSITCSDGATDGKIGHWTSAGGGSTQGHTPWQVLSKTNHVRVNEYATGSIYGFYYNYKADADF
tara:strand:- start:1871 stop:2959 length:1089 start_codon:yes stop_codon:yes gene_type:complete